MSNEPQPAPPRGSGGIIATVAGAAVDVLRASPALFVIIVCNLVVLWMIFHAATEAGARRDKLLIYTLEHCSNLKGSSNSIGATPRG